MKVPGYTSPGPSLFRCASLKMQKIFETKRLILRNIIPDDIDDLIKNYSTVESGYLEKDYYEFVKKKIKKYENLEV